MPHDTPDPAGQLATLDKNRGLFMVGYSTGGVEWIGETPPTKPPNHLVPLGPKAAFTKRRLVTLAQKGPHMYPAHNL